MDKYPQHHLVGYFRGKGVYAPDRLSNRSLSIEEDHGVMRAMTDKEITAWKQQQYDLAMTQKLEKERERAEQIAEDRFAEIGHGLSSGRPHMPTVDGMVI
jgi:hypothetical protein